MLSIGSRLDDVCRAAMADEVVVAPVHHCMRRIAI
jgi:hypothetical protein